MFKINDVVCFESYTEDKSLLTNSKNEFFKPMIGVVIDCFNVPSTKIIVYDILSNNMIFKVPNGLIKKV